MEEIAELVVAVVGAAIYGTEDKPRHPFWRTAVRIIAFSGAFVSMASFLGLLNDVTFPLVLTIVWGLCALIVLSAEYYVGSKKVCYAALTVFAIWLAALLSGAGVF